MILTHAEALARWAGKHGGALCSQRNGRVSYLAMAGRVNEWVVKGSVDIGPSKFSLRPAMRAILDLQEHAKRAKG